MLKSHGAMVKQSLRWSPSYSRGPCIPSSEEIESSRNHPARPFPSLNQWLYTLFDFGGDILEEKNTANADVKPGAGGVMEGFRESTCWVRE